MTVQFILFYRDSDVILTSQEGMSLILMESNQTILDWGWIPGTDRSLRGAPGRLRGFMDSPRRDISCRRYGCIPDRGWGLVRQLSQLNEQDGAIYRSFGLGADLKIVENHSKQPADAVGQLVR
jgi:hypothetical protein